MNSEVARPSLHRGSTSDVLEFCHRECAQYALVLCPFWKQGPIQVSYCFSCNCKQTLPALKLDQLQIAQLNWINSTRPCS